MLHMSVRYYLAVNVHGNHWVTVVMHSPNEEFQVLDSLYNLEDYIDVIEALRAEIAFDIERADSGYPDHSEWPIKQCKMPRQKDGNSCGLWVLKCMEEWDGSEFRISLTHTMVDSTREVMLAELIFSPSNELDWVKEKLVNTNVDDDDA